MRCILLQNPTAKTWDDLWNSTIKSHNENVGCFMAWFWLVHWHCGSHSACAAKSCSEHHKIAPWNRTANLATKTLEEFSKILLQNGAMQSYHKNMGCFMARFQTFNCVRGSVWSPRFISTTSITRRIHCSESGQDTHNELNFLSQHALQAVWLDWCWSPLASHLWVTMTVLDFVVAWHAVSPNAPLQRRFDPSRSIGWLSLWWLSTCVLLHVMWWCDQCTQWSSNAMTFSWQVELTLQRILPTMLNQRIGTSEENQITQMMATGRSHGNDMMSSHLTWKQWHSRETDASLVMKCLREQEKSMSYHRFTNLREIF